MIRAHGRRTEDAKLGLSTLVASTFFMVSGGAYGLEDLVGCGYAVAVAALVVTPLVWSLPTALMVGELASALPHEGGYYAWVRRAMGPFWGFQEAWLSLVASVFDMAIYPTLFTLYLGRLVPSLAPGASAAGAAAVGAALVVVCAVWNMRGASTVGVGSVALGVAILAPFALIGLIGFLVHLPASRATPAAQAPSVWMIGVLVAMWNYMGWDNASTIAQEVREPARTYPRAVLTALGLVALAYLWPVLGAAVAGLDPSGWTTGAWVGAAHDLGGRWLALAVVVGGMVSGLGTYNALLLSYSRVPAALAADGFFPAWLARRDPKTGAPWASIVACSIAYAACLGIGFARLVELDVLLYGASLALEFVALAVLRVREPALARPFRIPGGLAGAILCGLPPMALLAVALGDSVSSARGAGAGEETGAVSATSPLVLGGILVALGPVVYAFRSRGRRARRAR
jgi:amino acid transporter